MTNGKIIKIIIIEILIIIILTIQIKYVTLQTNNHVKR